MFRFQGSKTVRLLPSFEGAHRANTGDTLAGEVLLDLCTYDNMNIKSCQKVTESKQFIAFSELYTGLLGYITPLFYEYAQYSCI